MLPLLVLSLLLSSCLNETSRTRASTGGSQAQEEPFLLPPFENDLNVLQNGAMQSSTLFPLPADSREGILFWGQEIDSYIRVAARGEVHCLIAHFPEPAQKEYLLMASRPLSNGDTVNPQRYYYSVSPHDRDANKLFCNTADMGKNLQIGLSDMAFSPQDICPDCTISDITSRSLMLTNTYGQEVQSVKTHYLDIQIQLQHTSQPATTSCTSSSICRSKGFDCCSLNQCVRDGQPLQGVDPNNPEFLQSQKEIQQSPGKISDYPQFYHLCTLQVSSPKIPPPPKEDILNDTALLQELYDCTTPSEGEMGLCTLTWNNVEGSGTYDVPPDDRDFSYSYTNTRTPLLKRTIDRIIHGGEVLYENKQTLIPSSLQFGQSNDSLIDGQQITLSHAPLQDAPSTLKIRYKIDASCENIGYHLGRCYKIYVQGQEQGRIDDHYPASNEFLLPFYADTGKNIKVEIDDVTKLSGTHWRVESSPVPKIVFIPDQSPLFVRDNQTVKITFFVDLNQYPVMTSKQLALETIKTACQCQDTRCRLREATTGHECKYPPPQVAAPPPYQELSLNTKTAPHRYFDNQGNYIKKIGPQTARQEGVAFEYQNNNPLLPNNTTQYVGFNEIYGTLGPSIRNAFPAKEVSVVKGKNYNIYVDSGHFSNCLKCGNDYYNQIKKLFPHNFLHQGGGYYPDYVTTDRFSTQTPYRSDDLLFGRACWIPATMIPWSHSPMQNPQKQRMRRLSTQHFLFANGYQRDWYGFDYGAVIGSFDGVNWFAIGNQRHVHAKGNKLFIAINAYFGDLTRVNHFNVTVSESLPIHGSDVSDQYSTDNDGAECRKYHRCNTDRDCIAQLGWEYSCENITVLESRWPQFDSNALEAPDSSDTKNLMRLFDIKGNGSKRCVYRGRGAPCHPDYQVPSNSSSYSGSAKTGLNACSANSYCQVFADGTRVKKFNTRISRYGNPTSTLNDSTEVDFSDLNTFGLDAKLIGRPDRWVGREEVPPDIFSALNQNKVHALCLPGRNPTDPLLSIRDHNRTEPDINSLGDKVLNIGVTPQGETGQDHYLSGCSIYDEGGNYYQEDEDHLGDTLEEATFARQAASQAIPTNSLSRLESLIEEELITNFERIQIDEPILQDNRCLRAPSSSCFSDLDCAPSSFISRRTRAIDPDDDSLWATLNPYEIRYWQEDLICSQSAPPENEDYDLKNNRCCRETGKNLTIGTLVDQSRHVTPDPEIPVFDNQRVPALGATTGGIDLSEPARYTRNATLFDLSADPINYPPLQSARADACAGGCFTRTDMAWENQHNTFATTAERTCCSGHWIRHFHPDNGGGYSWQASKTQTIPKESFRCLNWLQCDSTANSCGNTPFTCDHTERADDPLCFAKSTTLFEAHPIFNHLGTLELLGIPQVKVKNEDWSELHCNIDPFDQEIDGAGTSLPDLIVPLTEAEYADAGRRFLAADDPNNFNTGIKQVFSPDTISCCLPAGSKVEEGENPERCCTGFINQASQRCQLRDFTNLSVYFNRYVSSHAKDVAPGLFNPETGYIDRPIHVETLACETNVCASGVIARGIVLNDFNIPGHSNSNIKIRRWLDANSDDAQGMDELYNSGQRWNEHVYCVPQDSSVPGVIDCNEE